MQSSSLLSEKQNKSDSLHGKSIELDNQANEAIEEVEMVEENDVPESIKEKVIPLYAPDDAVVKVFMVHGSQKSALVLGTFALGFQQQVSRYFFDFSINTLRYNKVQCVSVFILYSDTFDA
jgi:predicted nuclease with TOPRIM domain